jgi:hypothetical protein
VFSKESRDRDLAAELEGHLQMHIDDNLRAGMPPEVRTLGSSCGSEVHPELRRTMDVEPTCTARRGWPTEVLTGLLAYLALVACAAKAQQTPIDTRLAKAYFQDAQAASDRDHGMLWGQELYGSLLLMDPETRAVVANQPDGEGKLASRDGVYVGKLPAEIFPANTAIHWAGVDWTMVEWPPPELRQPRVRLLMHECFHRIQPRIGLPGADASPSHLDTREGRIWLEMEWRAIERAMWRQGAARQKAIADALYFRAYRRSLFPGAAAQENKLEMNEGLAEYTGVKLSTASLEEFAMVADATLRQAPDRHPNFVRSFAYDSGPAYGLLLDASGTPWRQGLTPQSDLGTLLARASGIEVSTVNEAEAVRRARPYDGEEIIALETQRDRDREARLGSARQRFITGPVLVLPVGAQFGYGFDPNHVLSVDESSTVYEGGQVSDAWGVLRAPGGFLIVRGTTHVVRVQVPAPANAQERPLKGDGWTLELTPGWTLAPGPRPGDFALKQN